MINLKLTIHTKELFQVSTIDSEILDGQGYQSSHYYDDVIKEVIREVVITIKEHELIEVITYGYS